MSAALPGLPLTAEQVLPGCSRQPLQRLFEVDDRTLAVIVRQLQVIGHRADDLKAAAVLSGRRHRIVAKSKPLAGPAVQVDDLDGTLAVPGDHLHLVLLARPGVLNDVGTGLAERQGDVGASIRRDSQGLQATVENLAADRHADSIPRKVKHYLDFHTIPLWEAEAGRRSNRPSRTTKIDPNGRWYYSVIRVRAYGRARPAGPSGPA